MRLVIEIGFPKIQNPMDLTQEHFNKIQKRADLVRLAQENEIPIEKALNKVKYEIELGKLQSEFVNLQKWIAQKKMRVAIIFEGRDAAGKGGSIKRFKEHLNPRNSRVVALQNLRILN
jgi:polyphosphate kinase 2 (PPK2 family)